MTEVVELYVVMHCEACAATVGRAIRKIPGVESYKVDFYGQKVTVVGKVDREDVCRRIRKTGKRATLIPKPAPPKKEEKKESSKEEKKESSKEEKKESSKEEKKEIPKEEKKESPKAEKPVGEKEENKVEPDVPDSPVVVRKKSMYWPAVRLWKFFIPREVKIHEKKEEVATLVEKKEESKKEESKGEEKVEGKEEEGSGKKDAESKQKEAEWVPMFVSAPFYTLPSQILVT